MKRYQVSCLLPEQCKTQGTNKYEINAEVRVYGKTIQNIPYSFDIPERSTEKVDPGITYIENLYKIW